MKEFSIFLSGLAAGFVIGLLMRRQGSSRASKMPDESHCTVITCDNRDGVPRISVKSRALPGDAPTERMPGQFPRSLDKYLPAELKSHTPEK